MSNKLHIQKNSIKYVNKRILRRSFNLYCEVCNFNDINVAVVSETILPIESKLRYEVLLNSKYHETPFGIMLDYVDLDDHKSMVIKGAMLGRELVKYIKWNLEDLLQ